MSRIVEVYVDVAVHGVDHVFHYLLPVHLQAVAGQAVRIPFGSRHLAGLIVGFAEQAPPNVKMKAVIDVLYDGEMMLTGEQLRLARLLADYYLCPLALILRQMVPFKLTLDASKWQRKKTRLVVVPLVQSIPESLGARAARQREALGRLLAVGELPLSEFPSHSAVKQLERKQLVRIIEVEERRSPLTGLITNETRPFSLTAEQASALYDLLQGLSKEGGATYLLHGVTGSGKTEVYLQLIQEALGLSRQCLMLVPEIALTPQMVQRFSARFGDLIAVWHSGLSPGERYDEWQRIKSGEARIVIGARSAIFAPFQELGIIILDEEHEPSYRQEENPRYHTRVVAQLRQKTSGCLLLLGSATPSLETYFASEHGRCQRIELTRRIESRAMPPVRLVDMRNEFRSGHYSLISRRLHQGLTDCLNRDEQAIILLNRRGFASFTICRDCGFVAFCPHCDISLTFHRSDNRLHCHYCGHTRPLLESCPDCGSDKLKSQGMGTERLERVLQESFPAARIGRMDADTTTHRNSHAKMLQDFANGTYNVLVGTQMIAKGLDFPKVTLVGVVSADIGLFIPDFRAAERTFQLLTQVAGRAGRGTRPGEVIIQSFNPDHYVISYAREHDYTGFYRHELGLRQRGSYPPVGYMITILLTNEREDTLIDDAARLTGLLQRALTGQAEVIGPNPCGVARIKNYYRWQIILKSSQRIALRQGLADAMKHYHRENRKTSVVLEFDA